MAWDGGGNGLGGVDTRTRHARLLAVAEVLSPHLNGPTSHRLARTLECLHSSSDLSTPGDEEDRVWLSRGLDRLNDSRITYWLSELDRLGEVGVSVVDLLDDAYPASLRMVHNRPPFLMVRGTLIPEDVRAMAVVGTRQPSEEGLATAREISQELAQRHITVVSGLARGIDTAAHEGALAGRGRTIAVFGTGIDVVYPAENRSLALRVASSGACVSQFWPSMRGAPWTFPVRNLVTSGLSIGTVVVEASETSGARLQAVAALEHGKRVLLVRRLVQTQPWAIEIAERPGVSVVDSVREVVEAVEHELQFDFVQLT